MYILKLGSGGRGLRIYLRELSRYEAPNVAISKSLARRGFEHTVFLVIIVMVQVIIIVEG